MFNNDYKEIKDQKGYIIYKTKVFINDFSYSFLDDTNTKIQFIIIQKRVVMYNSKLAQNQLLEIEKQEYKDYSRCLSKAKREGYGEKIQNMLTFKGRNGTKKKASINKEKDKVLCEYNLLVTSEIHLAREEIY